MNLQALLLSASLLAVVGAPPCRAAEPPGVNASTSAVTPSVDALSDIEPAAREKFETAVSELSSRLKLSPSQIVELRRIIGSSVLETKHELERLKIKLDAVKDKSSKEIRAMLNAQQRKQYDDMIEKQQAAMRSASSPGSGPWRQDYHPDSGAKNP